MTNRCPFIVFDGVEGAGKSTQIQHAHAWLLANDFPVAVTREPGGTLLGEALRNILLHSESTKISAEAELLMMFAARQQHIQEIIQPALEAGKWVLCDRFSDASFAYQGGGRGIEYEHIQKLVQWVQRGLQPDHVLLFDIDIEIGLKRLTRHRDKDRFEQEEAAFFLRVREGFLNRARRNPENYTVIDASGDEQEVRELVLSNLQSLVSKLSVT